MANRLSLGEFGERYQAVRQALWCVAVAVSPSCTDAEDALQEAAAIALGKLDDFDAETNFLAWMATIVRFVARGKRRKDARRKTSAVDPLTLDTHRAAEEAGRSARVAEAVDATGGLARDQDAFGDRMTAALWGLEESRRACLLLRTVVEMSYADIARTLEIPEATAMSHVHRARRALRELLGSMDVARAGAEGRGA